MSDTPSSPIGSLEQECLALKTAVQRGVDRCFDASAATEEAIEKLVCNVAAAILYGYAGGYSESISYTMFKRIVHDKAPRKEALAQAEDDVRGVLKAVFKQLLDAIEILEQDITDRAVTSMKPASKEAVGFAAISQAVKSTNQDNP